MTAGREVARALRAAYLTLHRQTNRVYWKSPCDTAGYGAFGPFPIESNDCLAKDGVTADQFVLLSALAEADAVTQQELVRRVGSDPNTVRAMLLLLEGHGLVARERHPADSRARCVTLTAKGRQVFKRLWTRSEPLRARLLAAFRPDELTTLVALLRRVAEVMAPPASNGSRTTR